MKKILIVDDEPNIRELVLYNLEQNGYVVIIAEDGKAGLELAETANPDLIILDLMLPFKSGEDICKELRSRGNNVPIIMLTAKNEEVDRILGLEFGADDYISKPFSTRELMARVKALLRRTNTYKAEITNLADSQEGILEIQDLVIDEVSREVYVQKKSVDLTLKEFELLLILAKNRGKVLTRDMLLDKVWGFEYIGETRTVDVHVRYLRKKLGDEDGDSKYIHTVRGVGYKLK